MLESVHTATQSLSALSPTDLPSRLQITQFASDPSPTATQPGLDVIQGLSKTPKTLPAKYFYDDPGSQLFEKICELPEYYPTRTETAILQAYASEIATITGPSELVELGSGSSTKTRLLLDAYVDIGLASWYCPIDVSGGILKQSAINLLKDYPTLNIHGYVGTYEAALAALPPSQLPTRMICFLGSTLGNLNPQECEHFFAELTQALQPGEYLLLGVDLQKSVQQLEAAYNDSQGVTAAFNLNMLQHLNQRFQGDFQVDNFQHQAFYNLDEHQIEMHLVSLKTQQVNLAALDLAVEFDQEETIRTEISRKFDLETLKQQLRSVSQELAESSDGGETSIQKELTPLRTWTDANQWFGLVLCQCQEISQVTQES
ncbi:L-histidine N(alpha)-methyltransferase [Acaryochloris marina]|uniref:L-histidine N(alpha)-methyltransferase n=1 Tax=Acaryochloris marina TaxID=155978 RepID=UPI001BAEEB5D|nr:L-histidine N(alpha)-methyltransferase [Acaryochloris marina]QUY44603.1 L-histidine N(alpha)-methyltransferase [Acaryochloris marina S15]